MNNPQTSTSPYGVRRLVAAFPSSIRLPSQTESGDTLSHSIKSLVLATALLTTILPIHAAPIETAMNAARMLEEDTFTSLDVAQLNASPFAKNNLTDDKIYQILADLEEFDAMAKLVDFLIFFNDKDMTSLKIEKITVSQGWGKFINNHEQEKNKLEEQKTAILNREINLGKTYPIIRAYQFEKPLEKETIKKTATATFKKLWGTVEDDKISFVENGVLCNYNGRDYLFALLGGNHVVCMGDELTMKETMERETTGKHADKLPVMKTLLDDKFTRLGAHTARIPDTRMRKAIFREVFTRPNFSDFIPQSQERVQSAVDALDGIVLGMDWTDKVSIELRLVFSTPEHAEYANGFIEVWLFGKIKDNLYGMAGKGMPFLDSLKTAFHDKTVDLSCKFTETDFEFFIEMLEKYPNNHFEFYGLKVIMNLLTGLIPSR